MLQPEVVHATSSDRDWDDNGLAAFRFDPIADSAGKRYAFRVTGKDSKGNVHYVGLGGLPKP